MALQKSVMRHKEFETVLKAIRDECSDLAWQLKHGYLDRIPLLLNKIESLARRGKCK